MRNAITRRLKRLEELEFQHRAKLGPSLVAILLERRRKCAIAGVESQNQIDRRDATWIPGGDLSRWLTSCSRTGENLTN